MTLPSDPYPLSAEVKLAEIVDSCLDDVRGQRPPAIKEHISQYPELAHLLTVLLPTVVELRSCLSESSDISAQHPPGL